MLDDTSVTDAHATFLQGGGNSPPGGSGQILDGGFRQAILGATFYGIGLESDDLLQPQFYVLIGAKGEPPVGLVRVAVLIDQKELNRFRARTGLDMSVFFENARLATTLRGATGAPLMGVGADALIVAKLVGDGREISAWRDLPIERARTDYVPLYTAVGARRHVRGEPPGRQHHWRARRGGPFHVAGRSLDCNRCLLVDPA